MVSPGLLHTLLFPSGGPSSRKSSLTPPCTSAYTDDGSHTWLTFAEQTVVNPASQCATSQGPWDTQTDREVGRQPPSISPKHSICFLLHSQKSPDRGPSWRDLGFSLLGRGRGPQMARAPPPTCVSLPWQLHFPTPSLKRQPSAKAVKGGSIQKGWGSGELRVSPGIQKTSWKRQLLARPGQSAWPKGQKATGYSCHRPSHKEPRCPGGVHIPLPACRGFGALGLSFPPELHPSPFPEALGQEQGCPPSVFPPERAGGAVRNTYAITTGGFENLLH